MNQSTLRKCSMLLAVAGVLAFAGTAVAQQSLSIVGSGTVQGTGSANFTVRATTTSPVEGYVIAVAYDNTKVAITNVTAAGSVAASNGAELVVPEILATGFTLGVVMDAGPPFNGQTIPAGTNQIFGTFTAQSILLLQQSDPDETTGFQFVDGVLNNPPLDNILVQGGLSIGQGQGLALNDSAPDALTIQPPPPATLTVESASAPSTGGGCARILLDNGAGATQGFVLSISHNNAVVTLTGINLAGTATAAAGAEFTAVNVLATGGTIGVVLDFVAPFLGQTIPAGNNIHVANYCYNCVNDIIYVEGDPVPPADVSDLTFVDGVFGTPPLSNVVVVGGLSINPILEDGTFSCEPVAVPLEDTTWYCGPASGPTGPIEAHAGDDVEICFFYTDSDDNLQGLQMAVCFDCNLTFNDFDISGSIFDAVGAEFVNWNIDNDPNDGDGCEFVLGILLDALPPFAGQTVPQTTTPLLVGCVDATVSPNAPCDECLLVEFCDGIDGAGNVEIENIAIINFQSIQNFDTVPCEVCVIPEDIFQRGDCNSDDKVDLADAAKTLGWQFQGEPIDCPDACDSNDDGKINLADAVLLMNYLFKFGDAPPDPGPEDDGPDPTDDNLPVCDSDDSVC